jgi:hypothetical protein
MPGRLRAPVGKLYDEPGSKTRLELWQGPFAEDQEATARAWWNRAVSHLDDVLAEGAS